MQATKPVFKDEALILKNIKAMFKNRKIAETPVTLHAISKYAKDLSSINTNLKNMIEGKAKFDFNNQFIAYTLNDIFKINNGTKMIATHYEGAMIDLYLGNKNSSKYTLDSRNPVSVNITGIPFEYHRSGIVTSLHSYVLDNLLDIELPYDGEIRKNILRFEEFRNILINIKGIDLSNVFDKNTYYTIQEVQKELTRNKDIFMLLSDFDIESKLNSLDKKIERMTRASI